jgi:hypothetical protein
MIYKAVIREILKRKVEIEADSKADAYLLAHEKYKNGDIVLNADDFDKFNITIRTNDKT